MESASERISASGNVSRGFCAGGSISASGIDFTREISGGLSAIWVSSMIASPFRFARVRFADCDRVRFAADVCLDDVLRLVFFDTISGTSLTGFGFGENAV